ncbi:MAG: acyltransferase family protein [Solirubrobacteraceae bacterium]
MPEPLQRSSRYMPALDGLRALAVCAVIAYHLGLGWAPGGLLGVGVFFTLSGYLITDLLLARWDHLPRRLGDFWARRARRLLPALYVMLVVVSVWVAIGSHSRLPDVRGQVGSALLYVNNWWQITRHVSYFARFGPPSPLSHLWSLAVEEQFYLIWPWLLIAGLRLVPERRRSIKVRPRLAGLTLALAAISAIEMVILYHPGFDSTRVYDGSDTRAFGLLIGAALAMVWPSRSLTARVSARAAKIVDGLGIAGLLVIVLMVWRTDQYSPFLYRGGLVVLSVASALVIVAGVHPASRLARVLGWRPLRWLGVRSYGIYLWHQPIIVLSTPASAHSVQPVRAVAQVGASVALAALSWRFVEEPIRHGALGRLRAQAREIHWHPRLLPLGVRATAGAVVLAVVLAGIGLAGVRPPKIGGSSPASTLTQRAELGSRRSRRRSSSSATTRTRATGRGTPTTGTTRASGTPTAASSSHSSCRAVAHIGDSTSEGLTSSNYLPDPAQRITAQYRRVGATQLHMEITPATSIVESLPGTTDAQSVARGLIQGGYHGCWVLALGTNDSADVYVGSNVSLAARITKMMSIIGNQPVMWVNVKSLVSSGPYAEANMERWDQALQQACARYPSMRIYDWASVVQNRWFIPDGIHYYSPGYAARAHLIANALAEAFPASGLSAAQGCTVHTRSLSIPVLEAHG